jgi:signal transduction histidine kinase/ligand-binding sensor domain-containing protein/DNA-binding response OmpR family regulator
MWFGTTAGLNRYDGNSFKVFKHKSGDSNSLNENNVSRICEAPDSTMWVYTHAGLSIYNSNTETFSTDIAGQLAKYKVLTDQVNSVKKDKEGNFWFLTNNRGIYCYNEKTNTTTLYSTSPDSKVGLHSNYVTDIVQGVNNVEWLVYSDGVIDGLNLHTNTIVLRSFTLSRANPGKTADYSITPGNGLDMWIYCTGSVLGAYCLNPQTNSLMHIGKDSPGLCLNTPVINTIVKNDDGKIWIGTDHGGINIFDLKARKVTYLLSRDDDNKSLRGNCVLLYKDNAGIIWVGTFKQGVSYYHKDIIQFPLVRHYSSNSASLPYEDVDCFVEDANQNLWIGTNGGGLIFYNQATKKYTQYRHDPAKSKSLSNDVVISLFIDHENKLWIGTYFGGLDRWNGDGFEHYRHSDTDPSSISDDRVYCIKEDSSSRLWVGTFAGSMNIYNRSANNFTHPEYNMLSEYTAVIYEDKQKNIWIGRDRGIDVIEKSTGKVKHYVNSVTNPNSLVANDVNSIIQDRNGLFWIGTKQGLSVLNSQTGKFINIDEQGGLPNSNVRNILEDKRGLIWVSTENGIASIQLIGSGDAHMFRIQKYDESDGLQGKEFNANSAFKTRDGEIIFGGPHGFNLFNPANIHPISLVPKLIFTDFQLFNKSVKVGDTIAGRVVLTKSIANTQYITLNHNQNVFSIEFASCYFFNPGKISYQYKLDGFDKEWQVSQNDARKVTYTNLDAGDYVFNVISGNTDDPDEEGVATLHIKILPPFWETSIAFVLYFIIAVGILFFIRHRGILKIKRGFELMQEKLEAERKAGREREEAQRMHELDLMKIKFFTNVSHEFRTPLSLIISPIENLIKQNNKPEQLQQLVMIKRNGKRLLNLVNQLLDFRKMEFKELKLNMQESDIIEFIKDVCSSFADMAEQNHISYLFDSEITMLQTRFDQDKIERVLFNLLSNSFKFTPPGGHISVFLSMSAVDETNGEQQLEIRIMDTGIGIAPDKQEKIFEPFFQDNLPEGLLNQGSGIGLSICREFVKMHGGDIFLESEPGDGSCFTIRIPVAVEYEKIDVAAMPEPVVASAKDNAHILTAGKKPLVLLIEDNDDLRFYLKDNLKQSFHIIEAIHGIDGWQKTLALHPDLIVSDITMPRMNGVELCNKIRHDERTAHIPVILLTALTGAGNQLAGTASGANDYITKPFNFEILLSKINALLLMQQTLKKTYQKQLDIEVQEMAIVSEDQKFLKNTLACIEKNITNTNFSVEELSRQMSLSRVSLYKRLLTLTGKTPVDCIRTIRLKKAVQLLEKSKLSIASVAYEVGFNNPTYFSKVFKEEYGMLPSEYLNEIRKREKDAAHQVTEFDDALNS